MSKIEYLWMQFVATRRITRRGLNARELAFMLYSDVTLAAIKWAETHQGDSSRD